jgi:hypothetical protein
MRPHEETIKLENPDTRYLVGNDTTVIMERRKKSSDFEFERWMKESLLDQKGFARSCDTMYYR